MGNYQFTVPSLGNKFIDYRQAIAGNSFTWSWVRPLEQVRYLVIHHSGGTDNETPDSIANYHVNNRGWGGVGYHFIISKNGNCYYVGDLTTARAHVYNYNHLALGICLIGSFMNGKEPSEEQIISAHELCSQLLFRSPDIAGIDGWEDLKGHKELQATACPGDSWVNYKNKIIQGISSPIDIDDNNEDLLEREKNIKELYQLVLGREADQEGLKIYLNGQLSIDEIRKAMITSDEHKQILNKASAFKEALKLAERGLEYSSKTYEKLENITKLVK